MRKKHTVTISEISFSLQTGHQEKEKHKENVNAMN